MSPYLKYSLFTEIDYTINLTHFFTFTLDNQFQSIVLIIELMKCDTVQSDYLLDDIHLNSIHN